MAAFWIALAFVFMAEMGDKTQLVALAFSTRFPARTVVLGISIASALSHLVAVMLGEAAGHLLPVFWINLLAGLFFLAFGWWTLRGGEDDEQSAPAKSTVSPLMSIATTFFVAEIGDKTMFATIALAAQQHNFMGVWLGSTLGMALAGALAVVIGKFAGKRLPERFIKLAAASVFFCTGTLSVVGALTGNIRLL